MGEWGALLKQTHVVYSYKATFRPQKLDRLRQKFPFRLGISELDVKLEKLPPLTEGEIRIRNVVRFTDLDVNRHVIASRYMLWILDSFPAEILENSSLRSFEINFMAEARLGDRIAVSIQPFDGRYLCTINRDGDGRVLCRARLVWGNTSTSPPPSNRSPVFRADSSAPGCHPAAL
jgi:acyl-ACP thioesterase